MPNYFYKATDPDGKWRSGEVEAADRREAEAALLGRGLVVEGLSEAELFTAGRDKLANRRELVELVEQLATLTRSGLPLPSGLRAAGMEAPAGPLRSTFFELAGLVETGGDLDAALTKAGRGFPPDLGGLIAAGSRTGRLAEMLGQYLEAANLGAELRRIFAYRLAYPLIVLALVLVQVGFICSLSLRVVEGLVGTLKDYGVDQPTMVRAMTGLAILVNAHGLQLMACLAIVAAASWGAYRFGMGPASRRRLLCSIPVVGPVLRYASLTEFCHRLAMLIEAETPLPLAFELAGSSVRDAEVAEACERMGRAVESGESLAMAMRRWDSIPAGLGQLFRWSEDRRTLPDALHLAGSMFEARARAQSSYASQVIATMLLLLVLWWLGFAVAALYMPLMSLFQVISKLSG